MGELSQSLFDLFKKYSLSKYARLFYIYFGLSFGLMLMQDFPLWDDYTIFGKSPDTINQMSYNVGNYYFGLAFIVNFLNLFIDNILFIRILNLSVFIASTFVFMWILRRFYGFENKSIFLIGILFLVLPFNSIKSFYCVMFYNISFLFFLIAAYFYLKKSYFTGLILFMISFITSSFIFYFIAVFFIISIIEWQRQGSFKFGKLSHLLIVPIFHLYKQYVAHPNGVYAEENYNQFTLENLKNAAINLGDFKAFFRLVYEYYIGLNNTKLFFLLAVFIISLAILHRYKLKENYSIRMMLSMAIVSIILILAAIYPYAVVGKIPIGLFYESRHQLILNLGFSLFCFVIYLSLHKTSVFLSNVYISMLCSFAVLLNYAFQSDLLINSNQQRIHFERILNKYKSDESVMIGVFDRNGKEIVDLNIWRIYELGSFLEVSKRKQNKVLYYQTMMDTSRIAMYKKIDHLYMKDFDVMNYKVDSIFVEIPKTNFNPFHPNGKL